MKIGIISLEKPNHFGDYIELWGLKSLLELEGQEATVLNNHQNPLMHRTRFNRLFHKLTVAEEEYDAYTVVCKEEHKRIEHRKIEHPLGKKICMVEGVLFCLQRRDYDVLKSMVPLKRRYLLVDVEGITKNEEFFIQQIAKHNNLSVINTSGLRAKTKDPSAILGLLSEAELVITNCFSTVIFALTYEKRLAVLRREDMNVEKKADAVVGRATDKAVRLLEALNLTRHVCAKGDKRYAIVEYDYENLERFQTSWEEYRNNKKTALSKLEDALQIGDRYDVIDCPNQIQKRACYGCLACKESCPTSAIRMVADKEGFKFPVTDWKRCIQCNLCIKVCIRRESRVIEFKDSYPKVFCTYNKNEDVRLKSSSGGMFPLFSCYVIEKLSGYVVGVRYDENMKVVADIADSMEKVQHFYGSKYVKCDMEGIYPRVKELLEKKEAVLFSGLPCECAGLRAYLGKDYDNLILSELICHASPSPKIFGQYIQYLNQKFGSKVENLEFRNKQTGWKIHKCSMKIALQNKKVISVNFRKNNYGRAFLKDYISRKCCTDCGYNYDQRVGDLTLGDFWGVAELYPEMFDDKGASLLILNNKKGQMIWDHVKQECKFLESDMETAFLKNHKKSIPLKLERVKLFQQIDKTSINDLLYQFNDLK